MKRSAVILAIGCATASLFPASVVSAGGENPPRCLGRDATMWVQDAPEGAEIQGTAGPDVIVGGPGDDTIDGRGGRDRICGKGGDDGLLGSGGGDRIKGGTGRDYIEGNR